MSENLAAAGSPPARFPRRSLEVRLFFTFWLIYLVHASPFVTREQYLAMSLVDDRSARLDKYYGLHSDLIEIPGRGVYLANNPGTSFLAAIPYALAYPVLAVVAPVRPVKDPEHITAQTSDPRLNRQKFFMKARQMGIEVRLGVVALLLAGFLMAPLAALSAIVMLRLLAACGFPQGFAVAMTVLYALGTPIFFRTGSLSQNLLVTLFALFAFALIWNPGAARPENETRRLVLAGFLAAFGVLCDYSGAIPAAALGLYAFAEQCRKRPVVQAFLHSLWYLAGAVLPIAVLLAWQWHNYGNAWLPVQNYMPERFVKGYQSEHGFGRPLPEALIGLMVHPLYGLLIFAPILGLAIYHFALLRQRVNRIPLRVAAFTWAHFVLLWVFLSMIHYTIRHQWLDGVRYIVPAVPFLFLLLADVLERIPRGLAWGLSAVAVLETWCLAMVRESPLDSMVRVFTHGLELPSVISFERVASNYSPVLAKLASPYLAYAIMGLLVWSVWRVGAAKNKAPAN